jgi:hypothetical protein
MLACFAIRSRHGAPCGASGRENPIDGCGERRDVLRTERARRQHDDGDHAQQ